MARRPAGRPGSKTPRAAVLLVRLSQLPRWAVLLPVLAAVVAGLAIPGLAGALFLLAVAALLGWLLATAWPVLAPAARLPRIVTIAIVVGYAVWKVWH